MLEFHKLSGMWYTLDIDQIKFQKMVMFLKNIKKMI